MGQARLERCEDCNGIGATFDDEHRQKTCRKCRGRGWMLVTDRVEEDYGDGG